MAENLGPGVSRILASDSTQYAGTVWQQGKPPCDSELNLMQSLAMGAVQSSVLRGMPSGFLGNETNPQRDFLTNPQWSNYFKFGPQRTGELSPIMWANVGGYLIPVAGTKAGAPPGRANDSDFSNWVTLDPPPSASGDFRIDFVFLEVWKARIQPNPSSTNKPGASVVYKYGNVEGGFSYLPDDLIDPAIGFETNQRVQIQYRIRVVKGLVGLSMNPDGFDPVVVKAQGAAEAPTSFPFVNMRQALGDPGLWRAGNGVQNALGTVDGYSYAVPIAAVFRRNSVVWNGNPSQNLNGGFNRNPTAIDRTGIKTFAALPTLAANMAADATSFTLSSVVDIPFPTSPTAPILIQVGDELMSYSSITGTTVNIAANSRGSNGTVAEAHKAGVPVQIVSGRPDGLFSDQIANTDILDLRHLVNPNGFDYRTLLKSNLDKLLRGQLRANWKLSGTGPRGAYIHYQDTLTTAAVSLGVTKLDAPDNIRMVFSDAATIQPIEVICQPSANDVDSGPGVSIGVTWSLPIVVNATKQDEGGKFKATDVLVIPINQLKAGLLPGPDQVRWLNDGVAGAVQLRFEGENGDLPPSMYTVTPANPGPKDDLTITFGPTFPEQAVNPTSAPRPLHIRVHAVYGGGRGLARRPDAIHSVSFITPSSDVMTQQWGIPGNNRGARVAWAPLWSKYRSSTLNDMLPVTSETYADLGSKTIVISPFRRVDFPPEFASAITMDGRAANLNSLAKTGTPTTGTLTAINGRAISVASITNVAVGDALVVQSGPGTGRYVVTAVAAGQITVERPVRAQAGATLNFSFYLAQGVMPRLSTTGGLKWNQTDPLGLFCGTSASTTGPGTASESLYVVLPRHLVPGWGELRVPIVATPTGSFETGINFMIRTSTGEGPSENEANYAAYYGGAGSKEYAVFSQVTPLGEPLTYNTASANEEWAGMRFFTDTRGLGREGLELPPFYGVARIFGVYQATDYITLGSPFNDFRESGTGGAVNLLRQSMAPQDGPPLWIEIDSDGDSTFILNAKAIDISKAPVPIANFGAGQYVIEAVVFGFDRGSFAGGGEFRLVLTRPGNPNGWPGNATDRTPNVNKAVAAPAALLPGPATRTDQIVVNYSRTPYQGDAWGSQTNNHDLPHQPGPVRSEDAYRLNTTKLDQTALTRPNQKVLEVLAATSFSTDLGTGRYSADAVTNQLDLRDVGYDDPTAYPPGSAVADPPRVLSGNFVAGDVTSIGTEYLGCTERLPLGALFRDKDFRGQAFTNLPAPLVYADVVGNGRVTGLARQSATEQVEHALNTATSGVASPGDILVHVDGEQVNYSLLTNYRVTRGGSVFTAGAPYPGGAISMQNAAAVTQSNHCNILHGRAMLVRNSVTNVDLRTSTPPTPPTPPENVGNEVSAGDELMMLIITSVHRPPLGTSASFITIGTNGAGEGYSAADLYRIEGHPLTKNNVHLQVDPSSIVLSPGR